MNTLTNHFIILSPSYLSNARAIPSMLFRPLFPSMPHYLFHCLTLIFLLSHIIFTAFTLSPFSSQFTHCLLKSPYLTSTSSSKVNIIRSFLILTSFIPYKNIFLVSLKLSTTFAPYPWFTRFYASTNIFLTTPYILRFSFMSYSLPILLNIRKDSIFL